MRVSVILPVEFDNRVFCSVESLNSFFQEKAIEFELIVSGRLQMPERLSNLARYVMASGKKGDNIVAALNYCTGDYVLLLDADLPASIEQVYDLIICAKSYDAVLGYRRYSSVLTPHQDRLFFRWLRTLAFMALLQLLFPQLRGYDSQYGVKIFRRPLLRSLIDAGIKRTGLGFDIELLLRLSSCPARVFHMPMLYRHNSHSVVRSVPAAVELLLTVLDLRFFDPLLSLDTYPHDLWGAYPHVARRARGRTAPVCQGDRGKSDLRFPDRVRSRPPSWGSDYL